jgi:hypothetical protein
MKLRLFILGFIMTFVAVGTVFAGGSYEVRNPRPIANCDATGVVIRYDIVANNFTGTRNAYFYVNGQETIRQLATISIPLTVTSPDFGVNAIVAAGPNPPDSVYRILIIVNGEVDIDMSWNCSTGEIQGLHHPFSDGRINRYDGAAPIAVYANGDGIQIWEVDANSEGHLALSISIAEIDAVGIPAENTLLGATEDGRISVWRLPNGDFQIVAPTASGKTYYLFFSSLGTDIGYTSYES